MKSTINSGVYNINLKGTNDAEFYGHHPTLILRSVKNSEMYYVFPLTTFTEERWEKCRKKYCCRIVTSNSIVRIDKVKILHRLEIISRWIKEDAFIIPEPKEIKNVYKKYQEYIKLSVDVALSDYKKYYDCYNKFVNIFHKSFCLYDFDDEFFIDLDNKFITFNSSLVYYLTFDDVKHIIYSFIPEQKIDIIPDKKNNIIKIEIKNDKLLLTIKKEYDNVMATKGNVNKSSVNKS